MQFIVDIRLLKVSSLCF